LQIRVGHLEAAHRIREGDFGNRLRDAEAQGANRRRVGGDDLAQHVEFALNHTALFIDDAARCRRFERARIAVEQFDAECFFKILQTARDGRLREAERERRL
jgi:hypothetical protein